MTLTTSHIALPASAFSPNHCTCNLLVRSQELLKKKDPPFKCDLTSASKYASTGCEGLWTDTSGLSGMTSNSVACQMSFMFIPPNLSRSVIRMRYSAGNSSGVSPKRRVGDTRFREHVHKVREIKPTIPWIALPYRIAPFGGGVPGAICDGLRQNGSVAHVARRTVDNNIT